MSDVLVKNLASGKVSVVIKGSLKGYFKNLLELFMNDSEKLKLNTHNVEMLTYIALINELYMKCNTELSMVKGDRKITLTKSQAYALWAMCQQYDDYAYTDPSMGGMLLQLHQKLS
jgi:hypothetical protein